MIRLTIPSIEEDDLAAVREVVASGYLVQGQRVAAFEEATAAYVGSQFAVAVSNCTAALHLSLLALGVGPGDIVIVPAYSFTATANVVELCGARPVFVDIDLDTYNLEPNRLEEAVGNLLSSSDTKERVRAIMPVHAFGQMADMRAICEVAARYNIPVIEDAACALGATLHGRQAGTWATAGCFSFHPRKAITTGEGGLIVTNEPAIASFARAMRNHGLDPDATSPDFIMPGFNYRITEFQAALGLTQMTKLERVVRARRRLAAHYDQLLEGTGVQAPAVASGSNPVYQSYVVMLPGEAATRRSEIITRLKEGGIETNLGTWHMPMTTYFRQRYGYKAGDFPVTDEVFARSMTLPLHEKLSREEQEVVVRSLTRLL